MNPPGRCVDQPSEDVDALGDVVQDGSAADEVVPVAQRVLSGVEAADLEIRQREAVEEARVDVTGDDVAGRADLLRQPMRDAAIPGADLEAGPARSDPELFEPEEHL